MPRDTGTPLGNGPGARILTGLAALAISAPLFAGFLSTETYLPAVGRVPGQNGAQFYTTVWATNLTGVAETFTFRFLKQGQANNSPASFTDTLAPGQTKVYENVVETKLGLSNTLGAARITSTGEILVAERIYNQAPGADVGDTEGLFFAGVPKSFSISLGQSASIQGVDQGGSENFRYNFALVETGGGSPTINVQLFDGNATLLGQKAYMLQPYEQIQPGVADIFPGIATTNARITATVTAGSGSVLLAGAQLANASQDSSGFEMSFRDDLLGGSGTAGVTSLNGLTGAVTLSAGSNISLAKTGNTITINAAAGGGGTGGLTAVSHDGTLSGSGALSSPLGVTFPLVATVPSGDAIDATTNGSGNDAAIKGTSSAGDGVRGISTTGTGVFAQSTQGYAIETAGGVLIMAGTGLGLGVFTSSTASAINAQNSGSGPGLSVSTSGGDAVYGASSSHYGVHGLGVSSGFAGVLGENGNGDGVDGTAKADGKSGVFGVTSGNGYGVFARATGTNGSALGASADNGGKAAHFYAGDVYIDNDLHVTKRIFAGTKDFEIDDPLDPENSRLVHASVESSEMVNIYSGNATLDGHGVATIGLPAWMEAENGDFRYQLTAIGGTQPGLYVAQKVRDRRFVIAGGAPGGEVSWQLTGVRHDRWALAHPLVVEEPKAERERGFYLHPELYGAPPERRMSRASEPDAVRP